MNSTPPMPVSLLIVDDDPVFSRYARQLISSLGGDFPCIIQSVDTADKAEAEVSNHLYDLVLLDYNLPDRNGLQVLEEIRKISPPRQPGVVMLTASGNESIAVEAMKRGARDYLTKANLDQPQILRALQSALSQKRLSEQLCACSLQMDADLKMARNLQLSLLPDGYPSFSANGESARSQLQFSHRFFPASQLAGDFFSVSPLPGKRAGIFICDVMGHGVRSALVTAMLRALVDDLAPHTEDPGKFLSELNDRLRIVFKQAGETLYATAFYLIVEPAAAQIYYANAGHPRPIHLAPQAGLASSLALPPHCGPALGLFDRARYLSIQAPLEVGDILLFFTDGLVEVTDASGEKDFNPELLLEAARHRLQLPLESLLDELVGEVRAFSGGAEFADDVCLLGLKFTP